MTKSAKKSFTKTLCLRLVCPSTHTDVLLGERAFGLGPARFAALAFRGDPLVHPRLGKSHISFSLHEGWVQMTLYCRGQCAAMAAMASHPKGRIKAVKFMANLGAVTGTDKCRPAGLQNTRQPFLLALLDRPFLKRSTAEEVNLALNAMALAGFGLLQHVRRNSKTMAGRVPLMLPEFPLFKTEHHMLPTKSQTKHR